jgi:RNA polymerase sigma factor (TIGR02999 family)
MPLVYQELRSLAKRHLAGQQAGHSLQTTDLVNEAYLKLAAIQHTDWQDRLHFLAVASRAMRCVLVDHARRRNYAKRGADPLRVTLKDDALVTEHRADEVLMVDEALSRLAELDSRKAQIVELRYFGGLTVGEAAEVVGFSPITVKREWAKAKAWLQRELAHERDGSARFEADRGGSGRLRDSRK